MDTHYYTTYQIDTTMVTHSLLIITEGGNIHCIGVPDIKEPKNADNVNVPGFTRFFRDRNSSEITTTYSRSCVWMTVDFSGTSIYPGPSSKICCPALGDESASGTPTTGAVSPLLNACPSVFGE
ncbi:hypothetical protein ATANTOWER_020896 [Ataeniobius toweri]|uniref:Uncharacterized protein n=1 Tax=Ataeniobius toweri TaxID=208326 RepID=A0ABU7BZY3_9TELE|nr:hypothetical protein [Ataeniobius toweri]